jgi:glucose uptake protein
LIIVESYSAVVVLCVITIFSSGSSADTQELAGKEWRCPLSYWDYVIGVWLLALIWASTQGGSAPPMPNLDEATRADLCTLDCSPVQTVRLPRLVPSICRRS